MGFPCRSRRRSRYARAMPHDLHLQPLAPSVQRATRRPIGFGYVPALGVRGVQALVDQWMRIFLTAKGSDPCDLDFGTDAVTLIGSTVSPDNAVEFLRNAVADCNAQLRAIQNKLPNKPDDGRLDDGIVTRAEADPTGPGVAVWVSISNVAGDSRVVLLPDLIALPEYDGG